MVKIVKLKNLKTIVIVIVILSTLVGYTYQNNVIVFPGGSRVYLGSGNSVENPDNFVLVENGRVYFTMYDEVQDITEYCSNETYFVDQVRIGGFRQTVIVGGDVNGEGDEAIHTAMEIGHIDEKVSPDIVAKIKTNDKDDIIVGSVSTNRSWPSFENEPSWFINAQNDLSIKFGGPGEVIKLN